MVAKPAIGGRYKIIRGLKPLIIYVQIFKVVVN